MKRFLFSCFYLSLSVLLAQSIKSPLNIHPSTSLDSTLSFRGVFAIDALNAWISGSKNSVFNTVDGGENWTNIFVDTSTILDFRDIEVLSDGSILLMSAGAGDKSRIYKSTNNGESWEIKFLMKHSNGFLNSFAFWNDNNGLAIGDPVDGCLYIIITHDGGNTWNEIDNNNLPKTLEGECGFAASGTIVTVFGDNSVWIATGGPAARVFQSENLGKSWDVFDTPILAGNSSSGIFSIFFYTENEGLILGGDYTKETNREKTIALTKDSGKTWELVKDSSLPFQSSVGYCNFENKKVFVSVGPSGTYFSQDGLVWDELSKEGFHCLSVSENKNVIWAAGSEGRVSKINIK